MVVKNNIQKQIIRRLKTGEATKLELAKSLDVSITAITSHINELKEAGYILEEKSSVYTGGRNPKILKLNTNGKYAFGISVSQDQVRVVLLNMLGEIIAVERYEGEIFGFDKYLERARELVIGMVNKYKISNKDIIASTISIPGPINRRLNMIEYLNFGYTNITFSLINSYFPNAYIENEANLSLLYEKHKRQIEGASIVVYLGLNEGLGAGIYSHHSFLESNIGYAGEIGNIIIDYKNNTRAEDIVSYTSILAKYNELSNSNLTNINDFIELAEEADPIALEVTRSVYRVLLVALQNVNMILDPEIIIVGGKMTRLLKRIGMVSKDDELFIASKNFSSQTTIIYSDNKNSTTIGAGLYGLSLTLGQKI